VELRKYRVASSFWEKFGQTFLFMKNEGKRKEIIFSDT